MPGFVDVSNWSDQDVKRLGHVDDADDPTPRYRGRGRATANRVAQASVSYSVADVWAAACAADRINGGYFKEDKYEYADNQPPKLANRRNRDVMMQFLANPGQLLVEDVERGEQCREFLTSDLTFRALQNKTTSFDDAVRKVLAVEERFDARLNRYELAIVACLPASVTRSQTRQTVDERVRFASGGLIGNLGNKVTLKDVEVLSANYSQQYNIFWIRGITDLDQVVLFSNKESFDAGTHLSIQGKVKAHRDNLTQLNYVKVL
jgi:hypothetical protein